MDTNNPEGSPNDVREAALRESMSPGIAFLLVVISVLVLLIILGIGGISRWIVGAGLALLTALLWRRENKRVLREGITAPGVPVVRHNGRPPFYAGLAQRPQS